MSLDIPVVFQKLEESIILRGNMLGDLSSLGKQYNISFQLIIAAPTVEEYQSIIHFTVGADNQNFGDRTPALWLTKGTSLIVGSTIDGVQDYNLETPSLSLGLHTWHNIEISQLLIGSHVHSNI